MTTSWLVAAACVLTACGEANPLSEIPHTEPIPADIPAACELANTRCSRCHSVERIVHAHVTEPREWHAYVHRMRLMPGSDIPPRDEDPITRCLVFRTTGNAGLATFEGGAR